ncbi:hypothetical protein [Helicobacter bilis]|nr:hypothetical protein [Helicobacter bilis]
MAKQKKRSQQNYWVRDLLGIANISPIVTGQERGTKKLGSTIHIYKLIIR